MAHWILQCDPRQWHIRDSFDTGRDTTVWTIRRHQREIAPGDDVAIWLSGQGSGIAALDTATGSARFGWVSAGDEGWWTVTHERAALSRNGTVSEPDPAAGLAANFSSTPRSAPPVPAAEPHPFRFPGGNRGRFSFVRGRCA